MQSARITDTAFACIVPATSGEPDTRYGVNSSPLQRLIVQFPGIVIAGPSQSTHPKTFRTTLHRGPRARKLRPRIQ